MSKLSVGVIVGRFQVPELTPGHKGLIAKVLTKHSLVIIFAGNSPLLLSKRNPIPYICREQMIRASFPTVSIHPLPDLKDDEKWDLALDRKIHEIAPYADITLYGSRDSFLKSYKGVHKTSYVDSIESESGTDVREACALMPINSVDFRRGIVYANYNHWPISYATVDIALYNEKDQFLLGKKHNQDEWRFIGGFSDASDDTFEFSAIREVEEESCIKIKEEDLEYIGSHRVKDWRYESEEDKIKTLFFKAKVPSTVSAKGADDIKEVAWFTREQMADLICDNMLVKEHIHLYKMLNKHLNK